MSFIFNKETFEDNSFNEVMQEKLMRALNPDMGDAAGFGGGSAGAVGAGGMEGDGGEGGGRGRGAGRDGGGVRGQGGGNGQNVKSGFSKVDILKSGITVKNVEFPTIPRLEILDLDVSTQSKSLIKGICKVSCRDAMVQITTEIEANLLLLHANSSPKFIMPKLISNDSFTVPITMTFDRIHLEAITNIFVKSTGVGISFNDVNLDFRLQCSIKLLQTSIEKRLKASMEEVFKDVLPSVIFNMSQRWFTHGELQAPTSNKLEVISQSVPQPKTILDDSDLTDLSPANMLRLSTLVSSRQTLCLNPTAINTISTIPGCLERQNLHRFNLRIPSLNNYYKEATGTRLEENVANQELWGRSANTPISAQSSFKIENTLPREVLDSNSYDLRVIAAIQTKIYERTGEDTPLRRRKIRVGRKRPPKSGSKAPNSPETSSSIGSATPLSPLSPSTSHDTITNTKRTSEPTAGAGAAMADTNILNPTKNIDDIIEGKTAQPVSAVSSSCMSGSTVTDSAEANLSSLSNILPQYPQISTTNLPLGKIYSQLNLLDDPYFHLHRRDLQELRTFLSSPIRGSRYYVVPQVLADSKDPPALLSDNGKRFSFVGIMNNQSWKWGNDPPPPYREVLSTNIN
ncbi:ERMES complex subunit MDM34 Ecym_1199 [Eremothecium cymbalariae DBVPG|uniref:Mitochondrial distribution and morphology protein 34 n=1 Tax=Eremothecium cymbalariae (strain CBS 270.75 / DBVPG 7215 / KCTC 17166 / NRRL Y-17582) TaxID=931890 RepID=G8JMY3_ERECY|nr:hypothetical protein Ecym_1199 [Eremothecium cymbalariae DBVPG\